MSLAEHVRAFMEGGPVLLAAEWSELHAFVDNSKASRDTIVSAWQSVSDTLLQRCHSEGVSTCRRGMAVCDILFRALSAVPGAVPGEAAGNRRETVDAVIHRTKYVVMAILRACPKRKLDGTWVNVDIERLFVEEANLHIQDIHRDRAAEELAMRQANHQRERQQRERVRRERAWLEMQRMEARRAEAQARANAESEEASSDCYFDLHKAIALK